MHVAFFTVRMRKGFGVDLVVDRWARGLLEPVDTQKTGSEPGVVDASKPVATLKPITDRVTVFCFDYDGETYKNAPYEIVPLHLRRDKINKVLPLFERDAQTTLRKLKTELGESGAFDIAMPASFPFYGVKRAFDVPTIHLHFGNPPTIGMKTVSRYNRRYLGLSDLANMRRNDRVIAISEYLKSGLPPSIFEKTDVVYPGADHLPQVGDAQINAMRVRIERDARGDDGDVYVLSVSRLDYKHHPYKGVLELVNLAAALRDKELPVRLVLAGVGARASIAELRARGAIVIDAPTFDELAALYRACDVFISLSRWEGFGLPVAEAAMAGLPTVALAVAAHKENAVSCPANSLEEAAENVAALVANSDLRREKGAQAFEMALKFNWDSSCKAIARAVDAAKRSEC